MTNKKRKGFTIVELVIVIAVIAILAGVLIPTFASIIDKANQSSDIQAVRQMNVLLKAESVEDKPTDVNKVIEIVSEAGYDTVEKRTPKSSGHGFYWHSGTNTIVLVKGTSELVYPKDNEALNTLFTGTEGTGFTVEGNDNFKNLAVEGESSGGGTDVTTNDPVVLKNALEAGENVTLSGPVTISEPITISEDVTIDLNGNTLTLVDDEIPGDGEYYSGSNVITINNGAILSINNSKETGSIIIEVPYCDYYEIYSCSGIWVNEGGTLNLNRVNIEGKRFINIENYGTLSISNSNFNVTNGYGIESNGPAAIKDTTFTTNCEYEYGGGYGFANNYSDPEDPEAVKITGGSFTASSTAAGSSVYSVYNYGGTMIIDGTTFNESEGVGNNTSIYSGGEHEGTITLENIKPNDSVSSSTKIKIHGLAEIKSGTFRSKIELTENSIIKIEGGKFYDGEAYVDFTNGLYYADTDSEGKKISTETLDAINQIISFKYTGNTDKNLSIVATTNTETSKTTYAIIDKFHTNSGRALFGEDMNVDANESVIMYLNTQGLYIDSNINVEGSLNVATGKINTVFAEGVEDSHILEDFTSGNGSIEVEGKIIVEEGATLILNATHYFKVVGGDANGKYSDVYGTTYSKDHFVKYTVTYSTSQ